MADSNIIKTEVQGIAASTIIAEFATIKKKLEQLQDTVNPDPDTQLMSRKEVARFLDISLPTLHAWSKNGILTSYRIGNKIRYKKHEVLEALQALK